MRDFDTNKSIRALRRLCKKHGIELLVRGGRGSHVLLIFLEPETDNSIKLVIGGHGRITPGVVREMTDYTAAARKWASIAKLAGVVLRILKDVFFSEE